MEVETLYDDAVRVEAVGEGLLLRPISQVRALCVGALVAHQGRQYEIVDGCPDGLADCAYVHARSTGTPE